MMCCVHTEAYTMFVLVINTYSTQYVSPSIRESSAYCSLSFFE